ncbi:MAG: hypothetical protein ABF273_07845 [Wenyingzhuangia sp.]
MKPHTQLSCNESIIQVRAGKYRIASMWSTCTLTAHKKTYF